MTDTTTPFDPPPGRGLGDYEGHDVVTATVSIRNTGHGLEEAMQVDPVKLPLGTTHYIVLECEVEKHRFDPVKDTDDLTLVNMLKAGRATIVDYDLVRDALNAQTERIEDAKAREAAGVDDMQATFDDIEPADALDVLEQAETVADQREFRRAQLDRRSKDDLSDLAAANDVETPAGATKSELVEELLAWEEAAGEPLEEPSE